MVPFESLTFMWQWEKQAVCAWRIECKARCKCCLYCLGQIKWLEGLTYQNKKTQMHEEKPENPTPLNTESFFDRFNLAKKKIMLVYSPCSVIGDFVWKQNVKRQLWHKTIKAQLWFSSSVYSFRDLQAWATLQTELCPEVGLLPACFFSFSVLKEVGTQS